MRKMLPAAGRLMALFSLIALCAFLANPAEAIDSVREVNSASIAAALNTLASSISAPLNANAHSVLIGATEGMETAGTGVTTNKLGIQGCATCVPVPVTVGSTINASAALGTGNGWTPLQESALSTTVKSIKTSAGQLGMLQCYNPNSVQIYVQLFNVASSSVTLGTTASTQSYGIAPLSTGGLSLSNPGINFSGAISAAATTTSSGSTAPPTAIDCNVAYN